jgi:acid phosphatase (class A)
MRLCPSPLSQWLALALLVVAPLRVGAEPLVYHSPTSVDPLVLLAPPPVRGSAEDAADLETSFRVYSAASAAEHARAADEVELTVFHFSSLIAPWFVPGKLPKTEALFNHVHDEAKAVAKIGKTYWKRPRPYHVDPVRFPNAIEHEDRTDYGYPSGHSTRGTVYALLLAELFPEKRDPLLEKGRDTGWLRVQGGVHYPTDVYAGRVLGQALARALLANPVFQKDLAAAKVELTAAAALAAKTNPAPQRAALR